MANNKVISVSDLIEKFQYALSNHWGYIYGTAGVLWTAEKQEALNKTTDAKRANSRKYGKKWIGHYVADCSGLFTWAFAQLGSYMYHGSNTMWKSYCTSKGELRNGKREDGQDLKPGTAVFVYKKAENNRSHVGLYIGKDENGVGWVIEAAGTIDGVIKSKITNSKWSEWGELVNVDYSGYVPPEPPPPTPVPPGKAIVTGKNVALRQGPSKSTSVMIRIPTGTEVNLAVIDGWTYVRRNTIYGFMMNDFISIGDQAVTVTRKNVAVRAGTGTNTKVLTRVPTGTVVPRAELPDGWTYIEYKGKKGFMMTEFLQIGG